MNTTAVSLQLRRLIAWLDENSRTKGFTGRFVDQPPIGEVYLTIDPRAQGPAASFNRNRAYLCGAEGRPERGLGQALREMFEEAGVRRFFVWLSPGKNVQQVRRWLELDGYAKVAWTRYPTLALLEAPERQVRSSPEIREVASDEVRNARDILGEAMGEEYESTVGKPGFHHFMAFESGRPIAVAALAVFDGLGYLTYASTAEEYRRRGAQQNLIRYRVQRAQELGCSAVYSETLSKLQDSHANLIRAGFREIYDKEVYCLDLDKAKRTV